MHIWVDGQCFQSGSRFRGIGRYVWELLQALLASENGPRISISFNAASADGTIVAREALSRLINPDDIHVWEGPSRIGEATEGYTAGRRLGEFALAHHVNCIDPDIALTTSFFEVINDWQIALPPLTLVKAQQVAIFYDAIPYRFPSKYLYDPSVKQVYLKQLEKLGAFDLLLCISEFAKREMEELHPGTKAVNISAGISEWIRTLMEAPSTSSARERLGLENGYVLYVGANDPRKNIRCMVDAFALLPRDLVIRHPLVMAGAAEPTLLERDTTAWALAGLPRDKLINAGHVTDHELVELYRGASVLLQPSLMEGFGLPSLEALSIGVPVIAGNAGAVPEVVQSPEFLFDPNDPKELAEKLARALQDRRSLDAAVAYAQEGVRDVTWSNSAARAISAFQNLTSRDSGSIEDRNPAERVMNSRNAIARSLPRALRNDPRAVRTFTLAEPLEPQRPRLFIDTTYICRVDHRTGIQRVVRNAAENIANDHPRSAHTFYCDHHGELLETGSSLQMPTKATTRVLEPGGADVLLMLDSSWDDIERFLPRLAEHRMRGGRIVFCIYDLVVLRAYGFTDGHMPPVFVRWFKYALMYATGFACISRAVADELLELLEAIELPRSVEVGYWQLGADLPGSKSPLLERGAQHAEAGKNAEAISQRASTDGSRFVMVGTMEPRKGYTVALDAFDLLWANGVDVRLTIVGKVGWACDHVMERIDRHIELNRRLFWHGGVSDLDLERHYQEADALISTSFAEGFGLPLVEAGRYGKPVIASDLPVFREVSAGANGASFFEVGSADDLARVVKAFIKTGPQERSEDQDDWPDWRESSRQLYDMVMNDRWYRTYCPEGPPRFKPLTDLGAIRMERALSVNEMQIRAEIVEGPIERAGEASVDYIVKIQNPTDQVWSSASPAHVDKPVHLSWKRFNRESLATIEEGGRVSIPFVLHPGDHHYVRFKVTKHDPIEEIVHFDAVQERVSWFTL